MFTGIVEMIGKVMHTQRTGGLLRLTIALPPALTDVVMGDSICVNGACLTVSDARQGNFYADVSLETLQRTNLGSLRPGDEVNLERALKINGRLGGHLVTGHVDGTGSISEITRGAGTMSMTIRVPREIAAFLVEKGSVAVEGVSLTVSKNQGDEFQVAVIPHTAGNTTIGKKRVGDRVNIEVDIIGKYVKRFIQQGTEGIDKDFLAEHGFDWE